MRVQLTAEARGWWSLPAADPWAVRRAEDVYVGPDQRRALEAMILAAESGGMVAAVSESGGGKTTIRRLMAHRLRADARPVQIIEPVTIDRTRLTSGGICEAIIDDLSSERPKQSPEFRSRQARRLLTTAAPEKKKALLIDEGHELHSATLRWLKRFHELATVGFDPLLGIIVLGQPELLPKLDDAQSWENREVARRMAVVEIGPLQRPGEIETYVSHRIGGRAFDPGAWAAIRARLTVRDRGGAEASTAYPLAVADLVTRALNLAAEMELRKVTPAVVGQA